MYKSPEGKTQEFTEMLESYDIHANDKYFKMFESMNTKGRYQSLLFLLMFLLTFSCAIMLLIFPLNKVLPNYQCFTELEFENNSLNNKISNQFEIIKDGICVDKFCNIDNSPSNTKNIMVIDNYSVINYITNFKILCYFKDFFNYLSMSCFLTRVLVCTIVTSIADKYGRYHIFIGMVIYLIVFNFLMLFCNTPNAIYLVVSLFKGINILW